MTRATLKATTITAFDIETSDADGDSLTVTVTGLPRWPVLLQRPGQRHGGQRPLQSRITLPPSRPTMAPTRRVTETFTVTVTDVSFPPVITAPDDKSYAQGATITAIDIAVSDADNDTLTVTVTGLPDGLSYDAATKQVSGTVSKTAAVQDYTATITANDGTNTAVTQDFTVTVTDVSFAPVITGPGDKTYRQGQTITAFDIVATDADGDTLTVTVTGLPTGLSYNVPPPRR